MHFKKNHISRILQHLQLHIVKQLAPNYEDNITWYQLIVILCESTSAKQI